MTAYDPRKNVIERLADMHASREESLSELVATKCPWCGGESAVTRRDLMQEDRAPRYHERCWIEATEVVE